MRLIFRYAKAFFGAFVSKETPEPTPLRIDQRAEEEKKALKKVKNKLFWTNQRADKYWGMLLENGICPSCGKAEVEIDDGGNTSSGYIGVPGVSAKAICKHCKKEVLCHKGPGGISPPIVI